MKHLFSIKKLFFNKNDDFRFSALVVLVFLFMFTPFLLPFFYSPYENHAESGVIYFLLQLILSFSVFCLFAARYLYKGFDYPGVVLALFLSSFSIIGFFFLFHSILP